jgi:hypothetical protein
LSALRRWVGGRSGTNTGSILVVTPIDGAQLQRDINVNQFDTTLSHSVTPDPSFAGAPPVSTDDQQREASPRVELELTRFR